jgi:hypothetical protein
MLPEITDFAGPLVLVAAGLALASATPSCRRATGA